MEPSLAFLLQKEIEVLQLKIKKINIENQELKILFNKLKKKVEVKPIPENRLYGPDPVL